MSSLPQALAFVALWEWGNRKDGGYTNDPVRELCVLQRAVTEKYTLKGCVMLTTSDLENKENLMEPQLKRGEQLAVCVQESIMDMDSVLDIISKTYVRYVGNT